MIGAGPAGLMAAERLALGGMDVTVFDRMPSPARKLLMAGLGGLNITHDEPLPRFLEHYGRAAERLAPAITAFPPAALRDWCAALGQPTFAGSSGRVFPVAMKASPLLRAWLARLQLQGVRFQFRHCWLGWDSAGRLRFDPPAFDQPAVVTPAATVLALGGASWPRLGSDGSWVAAFPAGAVSPFKPANCGFVADWSGHFRQRFEGQPLKRVTLRLAGAPVWGDMTITAQGVEGGPVYALAPELRDAIEATGSVTAALDLRPDLSTEMLAHRLRTPRRGRSLANFLRTTVGLPPLAIGLIRECGGASTDLSSTIKQLPLRLSATTGMARAISSAGGLKWDALAGWAARPGVFAAGEMLDWEAPTGGYLLQAAFSTGFAAGEAALEWLRRS